MATNILTIRANQFTRTFKRSVKRSEVDVYMMRKMRRDAVKRDNALLRKASKLTTNHKKELHEIQLIKERRSLLMINKLGEKKLQYSGEWSKDALRKLNQCWNWLDAISVRKKSWSKKHGKYFYWRLNEIGLTLSDCQQHSDAEIQKELLSPFIELMKKCYGMRSYIWKTEPQSNGNWHAHLVTDVYIEKEIILNVWNALQCKLGYLDNASVKNQNKGKASTHIKSIKNEREMKNYFVKEIVGAKRYCKKVHHVWSEKEHYYKSELNIFVTDEKGEKQELKRKMHSQIWNCSRNLKNKYLQYHATKNEGDFEFGTILKPHIYKIIPLQYSEIYLMKYQWWKKVGGFIQRDMCKLIKDIKSGISGQLEADLN